MRSTYLVLAVLVCANLAPAQVASLSGPVEAFAFDLPSRSVRPVIGFPGSSSFGPAVVEPLDFGSVAPQQNYAIVLKGVEWEFATQLDAKRPTLQPLAGITARPQGVAWSRDGSLAILYSLAGNWIQVISGMPTQPAVGAHVDVSSLGALSAVASDTTGKQIALAVIGQNAGQNAGIYMFESGTRTFLPLLALGKPVALSFSSDNATLFAIDASTGELSVINVASRSSQSISLAGLADPFAVGSAAINSSSQTIYIASGSDKILREYDLASRQTVADLRLNFLPTGLEQFGLNSFLVGSRVRAVDPLWLFVDSPQAATFFVPALPAQPLRAVRGSAR